MEAAIARPRRQSLLIGQRSLDVYNEGTDQGPKFVRWIIEKFRQWGFFIARHAWIAIALCLLISALATVKILLTNQRNDITGYTPYGARANDEYEEYQHFFSSAGLPVASYIFIVAKDNGSMTRPDYLDEAVQVLNFAMNNITIFNKDTGKNESYNQFCTSFCQINEPVRQFYNGYKILSEDQENPNNRIHLRYPISDMFGRSFSLQPNFFGVELFDEEKKTDEIPKLLGGEDEEAIELSNSTHLIDPVSKSQT